MYFGFPYKSMHRKLILKHPLKLVGKAKFKKSCHHLSVVDFEDWPVWIFSCDPPSVCQRLLAPEKSFRPPVVFRYCLACPVQVWSLALFFEFAFCQTLKTLVTLSDPCRAFVRWHCALHEPSTSPRAFWNYRGPRTLSGRAGLNTK